MNLAFSRAYGFPLDIGAKRRGLEAIASALGNGDVARAQVAALLLQLPEPQAPETPNQQCRVRDLLASGLLKADGDWDEEHPRTGTAPNRGWFATKPIAVEAPKPPKTDPRAGETAPTGGGHAPETEPGFVPPAPLAGTASLLAGDLSATALEALAALAARASIPMALFGAIFVPSGNGVVDEGAVPGRPDMTYAWARDEARVTFQILVDGQSRTLSVGTLGDGDVFRNADGEIVARMVQGPGQPPALVTSTDVLDRAAADLRGEIGDLAAAPSLDDLEPKLCPDPTPEPRTTSSENSIAYQEYVSKLPYGLAIAVGGVRFDGCDPVTGNLLEAKADIDLMFNQIDRLHDWIYREKDPEIQMEAQANAAPIAGRYVVWHAQTEKGFRGLRKIAQDLGKANLSVVYDPN